MLPGRLSPSPPTVVGSLNGNVYKTPNAVLSSEQALGESQVLTHTQTEVTEESVCTILTFSCFLQILPKYGWKNSRTPVFLGSFAQLPTTYK